MIKLAIYNRTENGNVEYVGVQEWESREQVIEYYSESKDAEREQLLGWPHPAVSWHGNLGFGEKA